MDDMSIRCRCASPHVVTVEPYASFDDTAYGFWINPVLLRQHALRQRLFVVILEHRNHCLIHNRPMIQGLCDEMNRRTVEPYTRLERTTVRR
jgi:hypothetical protein